MSDSGMKPAEYVVHWSNEPADRPGTPLVVLLHGFGANERDLASLIPQLPQNMTYASVRAPVAMGQGAYTWFELDVERLAYSSTSAKDAAEDLWGWLEAVRGEHTGVTLLGFSMGMAMGTSLLRAHPEAFTAMIGASGFAVDPADGDGFEDYFRDAELAELKVPFFWGRDQDDPIIPEALVEYTLGWARDHVELTKVLYAGVGHGIATQEIAHMGEFLTQVHAL